MLITSTALETWIHSYDHVHGRREAGSSVCLSLYFCACAHAAVHVYILCMHMHVSVHIKPMSCWTDPPPPIQLSDLDQSVVIWHMLSTTVCGPVTRTAPAFPNWVCFFVHMPGTYVTWAIFWVAKQIRSSCVRSGVWSHYPKWNELPPTMTEHVQPGQQPPAPVQLDNSGWSHQPELDWVGDCWFHVTWALKRHHKLDIS